MPLKPVNNEVIYFRINGTGYATDQCTIHEGNCTAITLGAALCEATNDNYTFTGPIGGTKSTNFVTTANLANNIIIISIPSDTFDIFIDEQVVAFMLEDKYTPKVPTCSVNAVLRNPVKHSFPAEEARQVVINAVLEKVWTSGYVDLHHIRNLYLISNTLGTHNSMAVNGELGILKKIPVNAD